jgi:hypothetical protein
VQLQWIEASMSLETIMRLMHILSVLLAVTALLIEVWHSSS